MHIQFIYQLRFLFIALTITLLISCEQEEPQLEKEQEEEYIKGNFGSQFLNYSQTFEANDTSNVYAYSSTKNQIRLLRSESSTPSQSIQVHFYDVQLDTMAVPIEFSTGQNHKGYAHILLQEYYSPPVDSTSVIAEDKSYIGMSYFDMKVRIISKANDILTGTFEGKMRSTIPLSGAKIEVKNGEFTIKIVRKKTGVWHQIPN